MDKSLEFTQLKIHICEWAARQISRYHYTFRCLADLPESVGYIDLSAFFP